MSDAISLKDSFEFSLGKGAREAVGLTGRVQGKLLSASGVVKQEIDISNLVVTTGKNYLAGLLAAETLNDMTHVAVGASATAPGAGDTALIGSELGRVASATPTRTGASVEFVATFPAGTATGTLNEAAIFDGAAGTVMLARVAFDGAVNKAADDEFQITWTITVS